MKDISVLNVFYTYNCALQQSIMLFDAQRKEVLLLSFQLNTWKLKNVKRFLFIFTRKTGSMKTCTYRPICVKYKNKA